MSIINQMLKDLDDRRGPANGAQLAALQGMGLLNANRIQWQNNLPLVGWIFAAVFAGIIGYQSMRWWPGEVQSAAPSGHALTASVPATPAPEVAPPVSIHAAADAKPSPVTVKPPHASPARVRTDPLLTPPAAPAPAPAPLKPIKTLTPEQRAERLFARAQQAFADHRQQRGEQLLHDALDTFPRHTEARIQLAALRVNQGQSGEAESVLADGLAGTPRSLDLAMPYAQLLAARDAPGPALDTLDHAIRQNPAHAEALALRAALLYRLGRHAASADAYRTALQMQPQRALWWTGLAVALEHDRQVAAALHAYRRAAELPQEQAVADYVQQRIRLLSRTPTQD